MNMTKEQCFDWLNDQAAGVTITVTADYSGKKYYVYNIVESNDLLCIEVTGTGRSLLDAVNRCADNTKNYQST